MTRRSIKLATIQAAVMLLAAGASWVSAQETRAGADDLSRFDGLREVVRTWGLFQEVKILETANEIALTSAQAAVCMDAIEAPFAELQGVWAIETSDELVRALAELRATLLFGEPVGEAHWTAIHAATVGRLQQAGAVAIGDEPLERRKAELADQIATAIAGVLTEAQLARLASSGPEQAARDVFDELTDSRAAPPAEWNAFRSGAIARIGQAFTQVGAAPEANLMDDLGAFFDRARTMNTDTYFARQDELRDELVQIVAGGAGAAGEVARMRAINRLAEWAEARTLMHLLSDIASANRHFIVP